ncbi:hypothetical protein NM688_g280 [Phlebia brevispora]|uniref:Uncharacterized protein n=1 Tax=Phlebia brevispora TaxID=194682 RepID=A0ACC1TF67_9APHY|nr:hypothetical protein NM688_g280 [Phlebia brevispora]
MSHPTILFPPPPPTHNTLTLTERSHLLRSNAKIGRLLGSTPHVLDGPQCTYSLTPASFLLERVAHHEAFAGNGPTYVSLSSNKKRRRRSADSGTFYEHPEGASSSLSRSTVEQGQSRSSCESSSSSASSSMHASYADSKAFRVPFPTAQRPPMLRLGKHNGSSCSLLASSLEEDASDSDPSAHSPTSPTFTIPSEASLRRQKMARLRKRLGEDVPAHLVFPPTVESDSDDEDMGIVESPTLPSPRPSQVEHCAPGQTMYKLGARRSRFVDPSSDVIHRDPRRRSVIFAKHRRESGTHGWESETFRGLTITCRRITTIPEE